MPRSMRKFGREAGQRFVDWSQSRPLSSFFAGRNFRMHEEGAGGTDDGSGGGGSGGAGGSDDGSAGGSGGGASKTFSQEDLNRIVKKEREKLEGNFKSKLQEQLDRVNKLSEEKNLSDEQRKQLSDSKAALEAELMTEREKAEADKKRLDSTHKKELDKVSGDRDKWQSLYESQMKETAILSAASNHEAYNPTQLTALVSPLTHVEEVTNDKGEPTGRYATIVRSAVMEKGDDGKEHLVEKSLSVDEYVEYLKGRKEYQNLFVTTRPGGTGHRQSTSGQGGPGQGMSSIGKIAAGLPAQS